MTGHGSRAEGSIKIDWSIFIAAIGACNRLENGVLQSPIQLVKKETAMQTEQVYSYKCPNCTGALRYDSEIERLKCDWCDSEFDLELLQALSESEAEAKKEQVPTDEHFGEFSGGEWEGVALNVCPNCGAEIVSEPTTAVTKCPYCANTAFIRENLSGAFKPNLVIPFSVSLDEAKAALVSFAKGKALLPSDFLREVKHQTSQGLYVPFWLYDCDSSGRISYRATKVHYWEDSKYRYTKTDHYFVERGGNMSFYNIPSDGSSKMNDSIMEAIEPYDMSKTVDFDAGYLSGYIADKYDVESSFNRARVAQRVLSSVRAEYQRTIVGYSTVNEQSQNIKVYDKGVKYALLPVWVLDYKYKDKRYTYTINGQTGKVAGELPMSWGRFFAWLGGLTAGLSAILSLILYNM